MHTRDRASRTGRLWLGFGLAFAAITTMNAQTRSPWQMHDGLEVTSSNPLGLVAFTCIPAQHGDACEYDVSNIPPIDHPAWGPAPDPLIINFSIPSRVCSAPVTCSRYGDFTYFQTLVDIPGPVVVTGFTITFSGMDDGSRVSIFNSAYPDGLVVPGSYVYLGGTGTTNLAPYVLSGEVNRVVVTQVDDCCRDNNLRRADVVLNGVVVDLCHSNADCDDANACTQDSCNAEGSCSHTAVDCDDRNVCTDDACDPTLTIAIGCLHTNNTNTCDDGDPCTAGDVCQSVFPFPANQCVGVPRDCDDSNVCTDDACNPATGDCVHTPNTDPCDDGNPCTGPDVCADGRCVPGTDGSAASALGGGLVQNVLVLTDASSCALNGCTHVDNLVTAFANAGANVTTDTTELTNGSAMAPSLVSGHDAVIVVTVTGAPIDAADIPVLQDAANTSASHAFLFFTDACAGCTIDSANAVLPIVNAVGGWTATLGAPDNTYPYLASLSASGIYNSAFAALPSISGGAYSPILGVPPPNVIYLAFGANPMSVVAAQTGQSACVFLTTDVTQFWVRGGVISLAQANALAQAYLDATMSSSGPCAPSACSDTDHDGYGSPGDCSCPAGPARDCDDADPSVHPGAPEVCNDIDDDCDGTADEDGACSGGPCSECGPGPEFVEQCGPFPPVGSDLIADNGAVVGIDIDGDCTRDFNFILRPCAAPNSLLRIDKVRGPLDDSVNFPGTRPVDGHLDVIDTEAVSLCLTDDVLTLVAGAGGPSTLPLTPSLGAVAEDPADTAMADSFFDVFAEVRGGPLGPVYNLQPLRVGSRISCLPPAANYAHPSPLCLPLYTAGTCSGGPNDGHACVYDADCPSGVCEGRLPVANLVSANHSVNQPLCGESAFPACGGNCPGGEACMPDTLSGTCQCVPCGTELCNGLDDDCDGTVDEDADSGCDDGNPCTDDTCENPGAPTAACTHPNNTASCEDDNRCTVGDVCSGGSCQPGTPADANDNNPCTDDTCDPATGQAEHIPNTNACDDGNLCTTGDLCSGGTCQANGTVDCNDGDECTVDDCDPALGCTHTARPDCGGGSCTVVDGAVISAGSLTSIVDANGDVTVVFTESTDINDNSYGRNAVSWPRDHKLNDLLGSDKAQFVFRDADGNVVFDFFLDYISKKPGTPSGYASLGVGGDEGHVSSGQASWLLDWSTSLETNLNDTGFCTGGSCTANGTNLLSNSPLTQPLNTSYAVTPEFSQWVFPIVYMVKVSHLAFGFAGFGGVSVPVVNNSPSKVGPNATLIGPCPCPDCDDRDPCTIDTCVIGGDGHQDDHADGHHDDHADAHHDDHADPHQDAHADDHRDDGGTPHCVHTPNPTCGQLADLLAGGGTTSP